VYLVLLKDIASGKHYGVANIDADEYVEMQIGNITQLKLSEVSNTASLDWDIVGKPNKIRQF
jgi:hypothetical protein